MCIYNIIGILLTMLSLSYVLRTPGARLEDLAHGRQVRAGGRRGAEALQQILMLYCYLDKNRLAISYS